MFLAKVVPLVFLSVSGVWAQFEMAQCQTGYDWVCLQFGSSDTAQSGVTAQCSDHFPCGPIEPQFPQSGSLHRWLPDGRIVSWSWWVDPSRTPFLSFLSIVVYFQWCTITRRSTPVNITFPQGLITPVTWTATVIPSCTSMKSRPLNEDHVLIYPSV